MNSRIKQGIIDLALKSDKEICGFIYNDSGLAKLFECENIATDKENTFEISAEDYIKCFNLGKIYGIYHSHVNQVSDFSIHDKELSEEMGIPIYVFSIKDNLFNLFIPNDLDISDYVGRTFCWGFDDCYGLVKDFYRKEYRIILSDYERDENFRNSDFDIVGELNKNDFKKVDSPEKGDIILFKGVKGAPKHLAIYMGEGKILHHGYKKLSCIKELGESALNIEGVYRK
jgi:proteasome lid subunit RPN8/RPN11